MALKSVVGKKFLLFTAANCREIFSMVSAPV